MAFKRSDAKNWTIVVNGIRQSSGTPIKADAEALERDLNQTAWYAEKMGIAPPRAWAEAVVQWKKDKGGRATFEWDRVKLDWLDPFLGGVKDLNQITRVRVDAIMQSRGVSMTACPANSTANRFVALISAILNAAAGEWEWGSKPPKLKKYPEPVSNGRALTPVEWMKLQRELPEHLRLAATFAVSTGLREAKVFGLKWGQLGTDQSLSFDGTANKLGNCIPLNATSQAIISTCRSLPVKSLTHVFSYFGRPMHEHGQASFKKAVERANIGPVKWKDFRTTFNSWLAQRGVGEDFRKRLMGHAGKESVQDRYTRLYIEHLRPFAAVIDDVLAEGVRDMAKVDSGEWVLQGSQIVRAESLAMVG